MGNCVRVLKEYGFSFSNPDAVILDEATKRELAMDSSVLFTAPNNGVLPIFTSYIDPKVIEVITAPLKSEEISATEKLGTWGDFEARFQISELTGETANYADYGNEGAVGTNINYPRREAYYYQTLIKYGDLEQAVGTKAKLNVIADKQAAAARTMAIKSNQINFFGVEGIENYGILNDPDLPAYLTPTTGASGSVAWSAKTVLEIYADFMLMVRALVKQSKGNISESDPMTFAMSPIMHTFLAQANEYGNSVKKYIQEAYPNVSFKTAPEYSTSAGEVVQLVADEILGQDTRRNAFIEKWHSHGAVRQASSVVEKVSAASFGNVLRQPIAIVQMLGAQ